MIKVIVIADDDTGMLDTGAQFAKYGFRTVALIGEVNEDKLRQMKADVVVLNTDTRHADREEAYRKVYTAAFAAVKAGASIIYKKTDSALRGCIGAELYAVMKAVPGEQIYFFPAFPKAGRTTEDGIQYVDGMPLKESVFAKDELNPAMASFVPEILQMPVDCKVELVKNTSDWIPDEKCGGVTVFDGSNQNHFRNNIQDFLKKCVPRLVAGCAGFAEELAGQMEKSEKTGRLLPKITKVFAVCGSSNPIARAQADYAEKHGYRRFTLTKKNLESRTDPGEIRRFIEEGASVILDMEYIPAETAEELHITKKELGYRIVNAINMVLHECMDMLEGYTLFLIGGDTLGRFIGMSGCDSIEVTGELSPGIAGNLFHIKDKELFVISKSGGFGDREILIQIKKEGEKNEREVESECRFSDCDGNIGDSLDR